MVVVMIMFIYKTQCKMMEALIQAEQTVWFTNLSG
jgi:hypothetical protein